MRKTILIKLGSRDLQWAQVAGVFIGIIAVLMLVKSAAVMFDSWQSVRDFNNCVEFSGVKELSNISSTDQLLAQMRYSDCKSSLYDLTGAQIPAMQKNMTTRQAVTALVEPIGWFFLWAAIFMLALFLLFNKAIIIPIEEVEHVVRPFKKK